MVLGQGVNLDFRVMVAKSTATVQRSKRVRWNKKKNSQEVQASPTVWEELQVVFKFSLPL
jgi:hypothetical protein